MRPKICVTIDDALVAFVDAEAKKAGETRSGMLERILLRGIAAGPPYPTAVGALVASKETK